MSPTLYQIDLRITNPRGQKLPPSLTLHSFKTQIKCPLGWPHPRIFQRILLSTPAIFRQHPSFLVHKAALVAKTDLTFPAFSSRVVEFAVQFCFRCKFIQRGATLESGLTVARFFSTNHDSLLRIATNEIASFWIDLRLRQLAFFLAKAGQRRGKGGAKGRLSCYVEIFWDKKGFSLLYKTNRFHVAVRLIQ